MRLRNVKNAREIVDNSSFVVHNPEEYKGKYNSEIFKNNNPIHLEIGMGKGNFIIDKATKNPDINFIGVERYESVLCRALEKLEDKQLPNVRIICVDAINLGDIFDKEIDTIYLNFSDPWPKVRHTHRRLSSKCFLERYDSLFKDEKKIIMKTDNRHLFEFSVKEFTDYGYKIDNLCLDIYNEEIEDNIPTEYEMKFSSKGFPIYMIEISKR